MKFTSAIDCKVLEVHFNNWIQGTLHSKFTSTLTTTYLKFTSTLTTTYLKFTSTIDYQRYNVLEVHFNKKISIPTS